MPFGVNLRFNIFAVACVEIVNSVLTQANNTNCELGLQHDQAGMRSMVSIQHLSHAGEGTCRARKSTGKVQQQHSSMERSWKRVGLKPSTTLSLVCAMHTHNVHDPSK